MDIDTFKLIRKLCAEFNLQPDIEFTCYEAYVAYFNRYFSHLDRRFEQMTIEYNGGTKQTNQLIEHTLDDVEETSLLHILTLISICAKYVNGHRCEKLITRLTKFLQINETPYSTRDIRISEYTVFKFLDFNVSITMNCAQKLFSKILTHACDSLLINRSKRHNCMSSYTN